MHHYYTYMRIIGETTYVLHETNKLEYASGQVTHDNAFRRMPRDENAIPAWIPHGHNPRLDDFLGIGPSSTELEHVTKSRENTHDDIGVDHSESADVAGSRYLKLYGLSQTWLSFVSRTTRLANLIDNITIGSNRAMDAQSFKALEDQKDQLEDAIYAFVASAGASLDDRVDRSSLDPHQNMVRALYPALVIFFNRRIRNVNSWILHEYVNQIIQIIRDFEASLLIHGLEGPGAPWPVFIAGCEAMSSAHREFFSEWMQAALDKTGFSRFQTMKDIMEEVWRRRDAGTGGNSWTWTALSRERSLYIMLT